MSDTTNLTARFELDLDVLADIIIHAYQTGVYKAADAVAADYELRSRHRAQESYHRGYHDGCNSERANPDPTVFGGPA